MAGKVKGVTVELSADATQLDRTLSEINQSTKKLNNELSTVKNALKFNPTSVELWAQKQNLLSAKVKDTKDKLKALKAEQKKLDAKGVDKNSAQYRKLQREIITTESRLKTFKAQLQQVGNVKLKAVSEQFKQVGNTLTEVGDRLKVVSAAAATVVAIMAGAAVKSGTWADDLNTMSKKYSISTGDLQKYARAAELVDVDVETIAKSHTKLTKSMASARDGSDKQAAAFKKLGINVTDSNGELRDSDEVFQEAIKALGDMDNATERDALAMQLFGKSATDLNLLIEDSGKTYKEVSDTFAKYGLEPVSQETLDKANEFNDKLDTIKAMGSQAFIELGAKIAEALLPYMEKLVTVVGNVISWLNNLSPQALTIIGIVAGAIAVLAPLLLIVGKLAFAISSIINLVSVVGPVIAGLAGPIGIAIAIIAALIAIGIVLYKNWDKIKATAIAVKNAVVKAFNGLKTAITNTFNAIKATATKVWNGIKSAVLKPVEALRDKIKAIIEKIKGFFSFKVKAPKIPLPHFSIKPDGWKLGDLVKGKIPSLGIKWYDQGGIFDRPSVIGVGEKRPEFVGALDDLRKIVREESGASSPITINVYGTDNMDVNELAKEIERRLIQAQNRRRVAW